MSQQPLPLKKAIPLRHEAQSRLSRFGIRFSPDMDAAFQEEMDATRLRRLRPSGVAGLIIYGLFAISDRLMLPDVYQQAWTIRFLLGMPLIALCAFGLDRVRGMLMREILLAATVVAVAASIVWMAALSRHGHAASYQSGLGLVVLFGNIVLTQRFRSALASSVIVAAMYALALIPMDQIDAAWRFNTWLLFASAAAISLIANFRMDQDQRRAYLAAAREQERNEELSDAVALLGKLSAEDALTGIANRREFDRRLMLEWGRARREAQPLAMILADIDFFKDYNDHYGHPAGDACLQRIAGVLRSIPQRATDLVARLGGEEFGVLLPATTIDDAAQLAESMRNAVLELNIRHPGSAAAPVVSASFGVAAMLPGSQDEPAQLLAYADAALYSAKKNGRNRIAIHVD